jgi:predicted dehydrogenase
MSAMKVGIVGCGNISPAYIKNLQGHFSKVAQIVACADISAEAARKRADEFKIPKACTVDELMADKSVQIVVDLTNPGAHHLVSQAALDAGKHVFVEKPLAVTLELARKMLATAEKKGLQIAGASDTFLGAGLQASRKAIDSDQIGSPSFAQALLGTGGKHRRYLAIYGGPLYDMGSYFITALISLFGPIARVSGITTNATLDDGGNAKVDSPLAFPFETPLSASAVLQFVSGQVATLTLAGETCRYFPRVEIYGTKATLITNDPNGYAGRVAIRDPDRKEVDVALEGGFAAEGRGLGVAELAHAISTGRTARANGKLMFHVLDVMHAIHRSSVTGTHVALTSTCEKPAAFDVAELL